MVLEMCSNPLVRRALLLVFLLAACGDDDATPDAGARDAGADAPAIDARSDEDASTDSGAEPDAAEPEDAGGEGSSVIVGVGYGGVRVRSLDEGATWIDETHLSAAGEDDMELLRGAAFGAGRFVALGWRFFSSPDGATWTEHDNPHGQWAGAVAYGNGRFLASGGGGYCARSTDGMTWETCTDVSDDDGFTHVRSVLFHDGRFYAADQRGVLRSSPDGDSWTVEDASFGDAWAGVVDGAVAVVPQDAPWRDADLQLRGAWRSHIERSTGGDFARVHTLGMDNSIFGANRFAFARGTVR